MPVFSCWEDEEESAKETEEVQSQDRREARRRCHHRSEAKKVLQRG